MPIYFQPPSVEGTGALAAPVVTLAAESDSGVLGDGRTTHSLVSLNVVGVSGAWAWLDLDADDTFDIGTDRPVVSGHIDIYLQPGENAFRFYQTDGNLVSTPAYLFAYLDAAAGLEQDAANDALLAQAAIAYWGRPLSANEHAMLGDLMARSGGQISAVVDYLGRSQEFFAVYAVPDLAVGIDRVYHLLYGRAAAAEEVAAWSAWVAGGGDVFDLPWQIATDASSTDRSVLASKILFAQQATTSFADNLGATGVAERTLVEVGRNLLDDVMKIDDVAVLYASIAARATSVSNGSAGPSVSLDPNSDSDVIGDFVTANAVVSFNVEGVGSGAIAWLDANNDGEFSPGVDYPAIGGVIVAPLESGNNAFAFYQVQGDTKSTPTYLTLRKDDDTALPELLTPVLDLDADDDDGSDNADDVTAKALVKINLSNLSDEADLAWVDIDGNAQFDVGGDISLNVIDGSASAVVPLDDGINSFTAYQTRDGVKSSPGHLTVVRITSDTVSVKAGSYVGDVISLELNRPIDWALLDVDGDRFLYADAPDAEGVELQVAIASGGTLNFNPPKVWTVPVPAAGSRFLTITNVNITDPDKDEANHLTILITGIPDGDGLGVTSNIVYGFEA